jgi:hypothetical protein
MARQQIAIPLFCDMILVILVVNFVEEFMNFTVFLKGNCLSS